MYIDFMEYKLRLDAKRVVELEKKLGKSPLSIFSGVQNGQMPGLGEMLLIIHAALQPYHSGIKEEAVYDIYDKWVESGKGFTDLLPVIIDLYRQCGLIPKDTDIDNSKN